MILNIEGARHKVVGALSLSGQHAISGLVVGHSSTLLQFLQLAAPDGATLPCFRFWHLESWQGAWHCSGAWSSCIIRLILQVRN